MNISLQAGHGLTPPSPLCYTRKSRLDHWHYQRSTIDLRGKECGHFGTEEGRQFIEDCYNMRFASCLAKKLIERGHRVFPLRGLDDKTGELELGVVHSIPDDLHPDLKPSDWVACERWRYCASVSTVLRTMEEGTKRPPRRGTRWRGWSWDPEAALWFERRQRNDLYLSIHVNAFTRPSIHGLEFFHYDRSRKGKAAAGIMAAAFVERFSGHRLDTGRPYKVHASRLFEVRRSGPPAVLVELGYQTSPGDLQALTDPDTADRLAEALAEGIDRIG
jgi:hypothetical protein